MTILEKIQKLSKGYSKVTYSGRNYGVVGSVFNNGKSYKILAEELGGNDIISLNYYITNKEDSLKPCEMPEEKVIRFLNNYKLIEQKI